MGKRKLTFEEIQKLETALLDVTHKICKENGINYTLICGSVLGAVRHGGPIPWDSDADITVAYDDYHRFCEVLEQQLPDWAMLYSYKSIRDYHRFFPRIGIKNVDSAVLHIDIFPQVGIPDSYEEQLKYSKKSARLNKMYYYKSVSGAKRLYKSRNKFVDFAKQIMKYVLKIVLLPLTKKKVCQILDNHFTKYKFKDSKYVMNPAGHYGMKNVLEKSYFTDLIEVDYDGVKVNIPREYDEYLKHYYGNYLEIPPEKDRQKPDSVNVLVDEDMNVKELFVS